MLAADSSCQMAPRRWALKSAPVEAVSELPLVPTNDAPICASHSGGGGGAAGGVCADTGIANTSKSNRAEIVGVGFMGPNRATRVPGVAPILLAPQRFSRVGRCGATRRQQT